MSGGGGYRHSAPSRSRLYQEAVSGTEQAAYETELEQFFSDALRDFNSRDVDAIREHLDNIEDAISNLIDGVVSVVFGGSVAKHTYVNGLSDVDMLVRLNDTSLADKNPREVLDYFEGVLRQRLPGTEISRGDLAVTVKYSDDHEIQLLPAIQTAQGYRIARADGSDWSRVVRPGRFAQKLSEVNRQLDGKLVPLIKLVKPINDRLPKQNRLPGYHIESLAIEAFEHYEGRLTYRGMIRHFWQESARRVLQPIVDNTGQSVHVDAYLGAAGSSDRLRVSQAIHNIVRSLDNAENIRSADEWRNLLEP